MSLVQYTKKRNFNDTPEPSERRSKAVSKKTLTFVIQRHQASHLHYDFRLEMEGVLKSWAVPKGPSLNPNDKRLAMMVEDHPYDYGSFEGEIPKGNYGAGVVEIWDKGTYEHISIKDPVEGNKQLLKDLKNGSIKIVLKGKKLKGEFALVKMKGDKPANSWLLIKHNDRYATHDAYNSEDYTPANSPVTKASKKKLK
jgi:bifunctional non-homologous end joining protein LigD